MSDKDVLRELLKKRDILSTKALVKWLFPRNAAAQNMTYYQAYIVKRIAFSEAKRLNISAFTRYGKTQFVAIGVAIYILLNKNKKVVFIGPTDEQAGIIKNYMAELILDCSLLLGIADIELRSKAERIRAEASQRRMTFSNGCEYRVVTAHGKGFSAMGHGGDLLVMDEAALISRESYSKIMRMLGDDAENAVFVELFNPWDRDTKAYDHSISPRFERIQISYRIGLEEGRITEDFVEEMRGDMTPLEFTVLYESRFPDEAEDSLHSLKHISRAEELSFGFLDEVKGILGKLEKKKELSESEYNFLVSELKRYDFRVSCDPADKGLDFTVMFWGVVKDKSFYELLGVWSEAKSESMSVVGKIVKKVQEFVPKGGFGSVYVDKIGIGTGTESRLREIKNELGLENIRVVGCHYGEGAVKNNEFQNKKAENHFRARDLFVEGRVSLKALVKDKDYVRVKSELLSMKWELTSTAKKKIVDPDKSPDFNDGVVYFVWLDRKELVADFI